VTVAAGGDHGGLVIQEQGTLQHPAASGDEIWAISRETGQDVRVLIERET
jgi:hypothetical protein